MQPGTENLGIMENIEKIMHWKSLYKCDLSGYTLVIPSVAVGNVGQLACDLVISTLQMRKIGVIYSVALVPIAGYDPYKRESTAITGCCEVYLCEAKKIVIVHLRSPPAQKYAQQFFEELMDKIKEENIKDLIILTSCYAHEKRHIMTSPFRYVVNDLCPHTNKIKTLDWVEHEPKGKSIIMFGGGFAPLLYDIVKQKSVPCLIIYKFSSEGNNIPDAYEMVHYLNSVITLFDEPDFYSKLIHPDSWNLLFGTPAPSCLY